MLAALAAAACAAAPADNSPPPLAPPQDGWAHAASPILAAGDLRDRAMWNDPSVLRTDDGYVMYATTSVGEPWKPPVLPFRLISTDGEKWSLSPARPLLDPVKPYSSIETPSVVRFGGRWHMFFTGIHSDPEPSPMSIGHAISSDGVHWQIVQPVLLKASGEAGDWRSYLVAEPGVAVVDGRLYVYFSAVGARAGGNPPQDQSIGVITSADGNEFTPARRVLAQGPRYAAEQGFAGYSSPAPVVGSDGRVHLFYSVAHFKESADPQWRQVALHHAVSSDGLGGFVEDQQPVLTQGSLPWTSGEVLAPAPLIDGDRLRLWFAGHVRNQDLGPLVNRGFRGPEFGIGHTSVPLTRLGAGGLHSTAAAARGEKAE